MPFFRYQTIDSLSLFLNINLQLTNKQTSQTPLFSQFQVYFIRFLQKQIQAIMNMMVSIFLIILFYQMSNQNQPETQIIQTPPASFCDIKCRDIQGNWVLLSKYKDCKALLIVNVASQCAYTDSNYKQLDQLREEFNGRGLQILAFPCNQFNNQQPGTNQEVRKFVNQNFNVKFPIFEKIQVNGKNTHPVYCYLRGYSQMGDADLTHCQKIQWNFTKFLMDQNGKIVKVFQPTKDLTPVRKAIQELLA